MSATEVGGESHAELLAKYSNAAAEYRFAEAEEKRASDLRRAAENKLGLARQALTRAIEHSIGDCDE